jgi:phage tail tape-measure protein
MVDANGRLRRRDGTWEVNAMLTVDMREMKFALAAGAAIGAIIGMLASGPLGASKVAAENAVQTASCGRNVCENVVWLRAPVRYGASQSR